jgi:hypothetical protein
LRNIISRNFLRQKLTFEVENCIKEQGSGQWQTSEIRLSIQNGQIISCTSTDDWIWIIRRISILYGIHHEYINSISQHNLEFDVFPFLSNQDIRDLILARTEHNLFVLCNTSQYQKLTHCQLNTQERKIQHILQNTGGYFFDLSLPLPNTIVDILWRNRQQEHMYAPLLSKFHTDNTSLENILFDSNQEPYHTLKKITQNIQFPSYSQKYPFTHSTFFSIQNDRAYILQKFDILFQDIISLLTDQTTYSEILDWISYHVLQLPIKYQISLYENTISKEITIVNDMLYEQSIYELLLRLSKSKRLRQSRNYIYNQLYQIQCI